MRLGCFRLRMMREFAVEPQADNITVNRINPISLGFPCCMSMGSSSLTATLAVKAKRLNRKVLAQVATIVTPETLSVTSSLIPQLPTFSNAMASSQYRGETVKRLGKSFSLDIGIRLLRRISSPWRCGLVRD